MALILESLARLLVLVFVVTSMLSMGLDLSVREILAPLSDLRLVGKALLANFVLVPLVAVSILVVIPLSEAQSIGLVLFATAAGAPYLPKLVDTAKGDLAFGVGLMILLMVLTVAYLPLVLPLFLPGVRVNPIDIAGSLVALMLLPLAAGLAVNLRYERFAGAAQPVMAQVSSTALVFLLVLVLVLNFQNFVSVIGTGAIVAIVAFVLASLAIGYALGGPDPRRRSVLGLGTGERNVSAALLVGAQNFADSDVLVMLAVGAIVMLLLLLVTAGEIGRRSTVWDESMQGPRSTESGRRMP